jgi:hypothetical protein
MMSDLLLLLLLLFLRYFVYEPEVNLSQRAILLSLLLQIVTLLLLLHLQTLLGVALLSTKALVQTCGTPVNVRQI